MLRNLLVAHTPGEIATSASDTIMAPHPAGIIVDRNTANCRENGRNRRERIPRQSFRSHVSKTSIPNACTAPFPATICTGLSGFIDPTNVRKIGLSLTSRLDDEFQLQQIVGPLAVGDAVSQLRVTAVHLCKLRRHFGTLVSKFLGDPKVTQKRRSHSAITEEVSHEIVPWQATMPCQRR